jgi:hypothetical protein
MNLVAYDTLSSPVDKARTWNDFANKRIMSREFPHRKYVTFGKRYNPEEGKTIHFIIILDDPPTDRLYNKLQFDGYGRSKISLKSIWEEIGFNRINSDCNLKVNHIEHTDDGDIYEIDF